MHCYAQNLDIPGGDFEYMRKSGVAKVAEVINPLTVKLEDGRFIHLAGLDMPDLDYYDPGDLAVTAQEVLDDFLKGQKVIIYQTPSSKEGRMNRMGHHIAHLVKADKGDGLWVQGLLISLGLARTRTTKYNPHMGEQMLALEAEARKGKFGLWAMEEYAVLTPDNAAGHIGSYQVVEGTVKSVSMYKNKLFLNFGNNWRNDFTLGITASNLRKFTKARIEPRRWSGKHVRVRGWIKSYNGPFIDIDHPQRIELLFQNGGEQQQKNLPIAKKSGTLRGRVQPSSPINAKGSSTEKQKDTGSALPNFND